MKVLIGFTIYNAQGSLKKVSNLMVQFPEEAESEVLDNFEHEELKGYSDSEIEFEIIDAEEWEAKNIEYYNQSENY
ncbi:MULTISPECIES: hypothetical protein [Lactococcus]|uniref:Uncharacterized protein n=2 Tax=Lactococcus TaxID=1357 RepID=A0A387BS63_9LACT|nr:MULTISPECIES: hypothetical protein [Lactococcus]AYG01311.1 hypothetical protein D7I46_09515 [Lactococcus allomyrinae]QDK70750.1 hypothetical protein FLP15_05760 [Lactococcus protaetiae]